MTRRSPDPKSGACAVSATPAALLSSHTPTRFCAGGETRTPMTVCRSPASQTGASASSATPAADVLVVVQDGVEPPASCASRRRSSN